MKILLLTVFFMTIFVVAGCAEEKEESIYGHSDKDNVKEDKDSFVKNDSDPKNDSDGAILPDDDSVINPDSDGAILPDNDDVVKADEDTFAPDVDQIVNTDDIPDYDSEIYPDDDSIFIPDVDYFQPAECGNGYVETGEFCEKSQSKKCELVDPEKYISGWANCAEDCKSWITTACVEPPCSSKPDLPDALFQDTNCDGIDGVIEDAVFVDQTNGSDINSGAKDDPVATIMKGLTVAQADGKKYVLVSGGSFSQNIVLKSNISIHGAYSGKPNWTRNALFETVINGGTQAVTGDWAGSITLSFLTVRSANASLSGASSIGMMLTNCEDIVLNNIKIIAGKGADGTDGIDGIPGLGGNPGDQGYEGCESSGALLCDSCSTPLGGNGGTSPCGRNGGKGGTPGKKGASGNMGENGVGSTDNGGAGDIGGNWDGMCLFYDGLAVHGREGLAGPHGSNGIGGSNFGTINGTVYNPSNGTNGVNGGDGQGGGGGGGGAGGNDYCDSYGSSGGGGGGAGCGGTKGTAGGGAGGSFALWIYKSDGIVLQSSSLQTLGGGDGGVGGEGAIGGLAGLGGSGGPYGGGGEQDDGGCGGWGGDGGNGGRGGHGGGGGGGPSVCLVKIESTVDGMIYTSYSIGTAGAGGYSDANSGSNGMAVQHVEY